MKVGVIGLGLMGYPIASSLHNRGHEVISWTRKPRVMPWFNSTDLSSHVTQELDFIIVASGNARPSLGGVKSEMMSTYDLVSNYVKEGGPRIIYLSSGAIYGECMEKRSENDLTNPSTEYGFAKLSVERAFLSLYGQDFCALRIGNVIDWDSPYGVLKAMSKALTEHRIVFYGNPTDCRDYVSIQDLTSTISKIVESRVFPDILNVGSGVDLQLGELEVILRETIRSEIEITWKEIGIGQLKETKLKVTKLKSTYGVSPKNPREIFTEFLTRGNS